MLSPRMEFQYKYYRIAPHDVENPKILNVGSANDPLKLGDVCMHVDLDDWSRVHKHFTQADASKLPFEDQSYHTVILGDVLEHVVSPKDVVEQIVRVCSNTLVITVFEEWKLPGPGQWIKEGQANSDIESQRLGYADREDYQRKLFPQRTGVDDTEIPHLIHINQFTDEDMQDMIGYICSKGFEPLELQKAPEAVHEDHQWYNWLFAFRRKEQE